MKSLLDFEYDGGLCFTNFNNFAKLKKIWISLAVSLVLIFYLCLGYLSKTGEIAAVPEYRHLYNTAVSGKKEAFVKQVLENEIDGPYDIGPLRDFCRSTERKWQPGLIVKCEASMGGFGNIKNMMLNCFRFAFEAGGKFLPFE